MKNTLYSIIERTPEPLRCVAGIGCPAVYETVNKTPERLDCIVGACPNISEVRGNDSYVIVGRQVNPEDYGLAHKVGEGEALIEVPKRLIDEMQRSNS